MILKTLRDIDSDKLLVSRQLNNGDFDFRYIVRIQYTAEYGDSAMERELGKYIVGVLAVSPDEAKKTDSFDSALKCMGWDLAQLESFGPLAPFEMLADYGCYAMLWESSGNNLAALMKQARAKLAEAEMLFGFAMDRAENAIGTTGWDAIKGDVLAPLSRRTADEGANVELMRKLHKGDQ